MQFFRKKDITQVVLLYWSRYVFDKILTAY